MHVQASFRQDGNIESVVSVGVEAGGKLSRDIKDHKFKRWTHHLCCRIDSDVSRQDTCQELIVIRSKRQILLCFLCFDSILQ